MTSQQQTGYSAASAPQIRSVRDHWRWFLIEGIILVLLGLGAILVPPIAGIAATIFLGWLFLIGGVVSLVATFRERGAPGFGWSVFSAIVALIAGAVLLWHPLAGLVTLTYVLIAYFIIDGIFMIALGIAHWRETSGRWHWIVVNGAIDLVLGAVILSGLPGSFAWALGLLVGIDLVFGGWTLITMALAARDAPA